MAPESEPLRVVDALAGKRVLITGTSGFLGKVTLSLLLERQPRLAGVFVLLRSRPDESAENRFYTGIASSPAFKPVKVRHGAGYLAYLKEKVVVLDGDIARPRFGLSDEDAAALEGQVDVIVNVAGLVAMAPALDDSLAANAWGALHAAQMAGRLGVPLIHISTCYVAGICQGTVHERVALTRAPSGAEGKFSAPEELARCEAEIGLLELESASKGLRGAAARLERRRLQERLSAEGLRRAKAWGWPNTYCYTKAIGERLIAAQPGLNYSIVRPSVVESAVSYPVAGWNEGMTTSAPVILSMARGGLLWPAHPSSCLDVIPVDMVASAIIAATGAALLGRNERVYHAGSSDTNPLGVRACMRLVGRYRRRYWKDHASGPAALQWLRTRANVLTVPAGVYRRLGAPGWRRGFGAAALWADRAGLRKLARRLGRREKDLAQIEYVVDTFMPFIYDIACVFKTDNLRALFNRLAPEDRRSLAWEPEKLDWRSYWLDVHTPGLRKWVFPQWVTAGEGDRFRGARGPFNGLVRGVIAWTIRKTYDHVFSCRVEGAANVPASGSFIVAANHSSHLDMGLIKHALGPAGREICALAARDYFFTPPLRRFFFTRFTNTIPIGRRAGLKDSFELAGKAIAAGRNVLIFPEGTRSLSGSMAPFKPSLGYLALNNQADVLPVQVSGTFEALPKGSVLPRRRRLQAKIGRLMTYQELKARTQHLELDEAYRTATALVEQAVRELGDCRVQAATEPVSTGGFTEPAATAASG